MIIAFRQFHAWLIGMLTFPDANVKNSSKPKFETEKCMTCDHPKGCHGVGFCWAYGLVEPKCRKRCTGFKRDNLKWLEGESKKHANPPEVQRLRS